MSIQFLKIFLSCCTAASMLPAARLLFHFFQLESYQFPGYRRTCLRNLRRAVMPGLILTLPILAAGLLMSSAGLFLQILGMLLALAAVAAGWQIHRKAAKTPEKKKFVYTARVKRLYLVSGLVWFLLALLLASVCGFFMAAILPLLLPVWLALGGLMAWPVEKLISEMYFRDARRMLNRQQDLIKIGITGSYGKTSVKFILKAILSEKFNVLATPSSFNTPMGLTKTIRTQLQPGHQIFLAEMGARHVGDIRELCRLVHPTMGVITSVGPQHLDTFKTQERINRTKYELIDALPADGTAFFPDDGDICTGLWEKTEKPKHLAGFNSSRDDVWADEITVSASGSSFTLHMDEEAVRCTTCLLGEHNISNIVLAAAVGRELGMSARQITRGIARIQPIEHRLQLRPYGDKILIDDAFNANPRGTKRALQVLSAFDGRRIIVTPGMVELGENEDQYNREFGREIASAADIALLIGKRHTAPIAEGLREAGFAEENLHAFDSINEAFAWLHTGGHPGDVVLLENDLPDHYTE